MKSITPLGLKWELMRSYWLIWLLVHLGFTIFISFFYIEIRVRQLKWMIAGFVYLGIVIQAFVFTELFPEEHIVFDLSVGIIIFGWVAACVHAFLARSEYLYLLARKLHPEQVTEVHFKKKQPTRMNIKEKQPKKTIIPTKQEEKNPQVINMNKATEEELKQLPSIGPFLAKQIIAVRKKVKRFASYAHLVEVLEIKPHVLLKAKEFMVFSDEELETPDEPKEKQKATLTKKSGRIVDY